MDIKFQISWHELLSIKINPVEVLPFPRCLLLYDEKAFVKAIFFQSCVQYKVRIYLGANLLS